MKRKIKILFSLALLVIFPLISFSQQSKIDSLLSALKASKEDTNKVNTSNTLSGKYWQVGQNVEAMKFANDALILSEKINFQSGKAKSLLNLGTVYWYQGNYPEALKKYIDVLKIGEVLKDKKMISNAYYAIGNVYVNQENYSEALNNYLSALKTKELLGDKVGIADIYSNIGIVYRNQTRYTEALKSYSASLKIREEIGDKNGIATCYNNIGNIYLAEKNYLEASKHYFKSLRVLELVDNKQGIALSYNNIGIAAVFLKKYSEAREFLNKGLFLSIKIGNKKAIKSSYGYLAQLDSAQGNYNQAYQHFKMYSIYKDSLINEESIKKTERTKNQYEFDKKESLAKAEQDKKDVIAEEEKRRQSMFLFSVIVGLLLVAVFSIFMFNRWRVTQRQKHIIDEQKKLVEEKNKDITDSINYAQRIQRALLASDNLLTPALKGGFSTDYFVLFKPKDIVSGDFYWATEKEGRFYLAVCDSTGHGVPGAFMSLLNISFLNEAINEEEIIQPNEIFNHVRQRLIQNISQDGGKDGMDGILVCFDRNKKEISYSAAHNAPIIVINGTLTELDSDNMPVGMADRLDSFLHQTPNLEPGTVLYLYTDGFADQFGGPKGKKFKYKQLNDLLLANSNKPMNEQRDVLEKTFEDWRGDLEQVDDVLVIGIRI